MNKKLLIVGLIALFILVLSGLTYAKSIQPIDNKYIPERESTQIPPNFLSKENFQQMIDYMRAKGYGDMADYMQSIGREGMWKMHQNLNGADSLNDSLSGNTSCH
ncbi:MAG TPA: hypothetical protein GXX35_02385 [Thermoanaerobacterales bacterium]|nr:hypothetical protein [Thermoanaerobacterales bacterium]